MLSIRVDDREMRKAFKELRERQIPYAIAGALNDVAEHARQDIVANMESVFDRPTKFTLNAFYTQKAGPKRLTATVGIRDFAGKGTPAWKYLQPQIEGGTRRMKRFERALAPLSGGQYIVPGRGAKLDAYGNISRGQVAQILSRLSASNDPTQNMTDKTTARLKKKGLIAKGAKSDYFVARSKRGNRRPLGVYQLIGPGQVQPVLVFTQKSPTYKKRFNPEAVVLQALGRYGEAAMARSLAHELATAKD